MKKIAIIGAGISGLTVGQLLKDKYEVKLFEKETTPGGLIRCRRVNGSLYHICGGHVFNSKRKEVLDWFWAFFSCDDEFVKADRNSVVFMEDGVVIPYPIENHAYLFNDEMLKSFISDLITLVKCEGDDPPANFEEFLKRRFGLTLYENYFRPYNEKVWRKDLKQVPLSWLEGKLPMPTIAEMMYNNINHIKEKQFVHSTFWYEKQGGSQLIADRLAEGLDIVFNTEIEHIERLGMSYVINGEHFDKVIFCGNIKTLPSLISNGTVYEKVILREAEISALESHGTTSVFCSIDKNPYSWIYMPSKLHASHRIICTGNFASTNNAEGLMTASIEFTDKITKEEILDNLERIPLHPQYLDHCYSKYTYPIQNSTTRQMIKDLKADLAVEGLYLTGRFADWEYYNMDVAIGAAMDMVRDNHLI